MSQREQKLERECQILKSEVAALEALVERYQDELQAIGAGSHPRGSALGSKVTRVEETLFEHQRLYPTGWETRLAEGDRLSLCRADGDECAFDKVTLPSTDWEWVSGWYHDVIHTCTDENGWSYAGSWDQLDEVDRPPNSEKTLQDRVRRRVWKRERMLVSVSGLPAVLTRQLQVESRIAAMEHANEKLTEQLLRANQRVSESDDRTQQYESQLVRLQDIARRLSDNSDTPPASSRHRRNSRRVSTISRATSPRFSTSSKNNADVLSQTEALLDQILSGPGLANLDLATTIDAQERRSIMVEACQLELQSAVSEFHDLVGQSTTASLAKPQERDKKASKQ